MALLAVKDGSFTVEHDGRTLYTGSSVDVAYGAHGAKGLPAGLDEFRAGLKAIKAVPTSRPLRLRVRAFGESQDSHKLIAGVVLAMASELHAGVRGLELEVGGYGGSLPAVLETETVPADEQKVVEKAK